MRKTFFILAVLLCTLTVSINAQSAVSTENAKNFVNKDTTVVGVATQVNTTKSGVTFINMDGKFPENKFSAIIYKDDSSKFEDVKKMEGKTIEVSGKIQEYNGKYNIVLKEPKQLKEVDHKAEKKSAKATKKTGKK